MQPCRIEIGEVPAFHFQLYWSSKDKLVPVGIQTRIVMVWWLLNLRALALKGTFITEYFMKSALVLYLVAA